MPINFPSSPTSGSQYTYGSKTWQWNGYAWDIVTPTTISTFNGCTSSAITITGTANEVTVDTTCPNIVIGLPNNLVVQNLTVTGSLLVNGGITTQISEVVLIEDNFVTLNANVTAGAPTENAGIIISRGASANVDLRWNETSDNWQFTNNGTDYWNLPINVVNTFNGLTGAVSFAVPVASFTVTGAASFNGNDFTVGSTGHVGLTGTIARTNVTNIFTASQTISAYQPYFLIEDTNTSAFFDIIPNTGMIRLGNAFYDQYLLFNGLSDSTVTLPDFTTTLAGLSGTQEFTGRKTFSSLASFSNGLSANGATFSGNISAPNIVNSVNGSTGAITIQGLTGITASVSGQTIRLSHVVTNDNTSNTRYLAFYGVTSGVDVAKVDENLRYNPLVNTISAYGGLVLNGLSSGGVATPNQIVLTDPNIGGISINSSNYIVDIFSAGGAGDVSSIRLISYDGLDNGWKAKITPATFYSADRTFTLPDDSGIVALTKNVATSVNGATGEIGITGAGAILFTQSGKTGTFNARLASASATGVASFGNEFVVSALGAVSLTSNYVKSFNGSTGAVTFAVPLASATATGAASFGNEFVVSAAGAVSLTANYVKSINGSTGAVVSIATTGANTFTGLQTMNGGLTTNHLYVSQGVTFNSTSVHTGLGTFNGGITSNHLYVSQGVTFAGTVASDTGYRITSNAINSQTGTSYTLTGTDNGKVVTFNNGSTTTVTIPTGLPIGFNCTAIQLGAGQVGFTAASGVTMNAYASAYKISGQHGAAALVSYTTNIFNLSGTLSV